MARMACGASSTASHPLQRTSCITSDLPISSRYAAIKQGRSSQVCLFGANPVKNKTAVLTSGMYTVDFRTMDGCRLGISRYPDFEYNGLGGCGVGIGEACNGEVHVEFDVEGIYIPALTGATTKFLGLPLPPFLKIDIKPEVFRGSIDLKTGKVELLFKSKFTFSVSSIYHAPPLIVETTLTSEESRGSLRKGSGKRLDNDGRCKLVGVATVDTVDDAFLNTFLGLPTECIASLNADITVTGPA